MQDTATPTLGADQSIAASCSPTQTTRSAQVASLTYGALAVLGWAIFRGDYHPIERKLKECRGHKKGFCSAGQHHLLSGDAPVCSLATTTPLRQESQNDCSG